MLSPGIYGEINQIYGRASHITLHVSQLFLHKTSRGDHSHICADTPLASPLRLPDRVETAMNIVSNPGMDVAQRILCLACILRNTTE